MPGALLAETASSATDPRWLVHPRSRNVLQRAESLPPDGLVEALGLEIAAGYLPRGVLVPGTLSAG